MPNCKCTVYYCNEIAKQNLRHNKCNLYCDHHKCTFIHINGNECWRASSYGLKVCNLHRNKHFRKKHFSV